jgi:hypothetical protein
MSIPKIPADAIPFYCADAYSLEVQPGNPWDHWPGVFNTEGAIPAGATVDIWLSNGQLALMQPDETVTLFNVDVRIGLYDIGVGGRCVPEIIARYRWNGGEGPLMNAVSGYGRNISGNYNFSWPVPVHLTAPSTGGPYLIGAKFSIWSGITSAMRCHYLYHMQGAWKVTG